MSERDREVPIYVDRSKQITRSIKDLAAELEAATDQALIEITRWGWLQKQPYPFEPPGAIPPVLPVEDEQML